LVREIIAWRLGQYLGRSQHEAEPQEEAQKGTLPNSTLELWREYARSDIPRHFGATFNAGSWNSGIVVIGQDMILLVTLKKDDLSAGNDYLDHFIDSTKFQWQTQNRTTRTSRHGQIINGTLPNHRVHLFVRPAKLRGTKGAPFIYCGVVTFKSWQGDEPITVIWNLSSTVPAHLRRLFGVDAAD
jgi:hypothetical protein